MPTCSSLCRQTASAERAAVCLCRLPRSGGRCCSVDAQDPQVSSRCFALGALSRPDARSGAASQPSISSTRWAHLSSASRMTYTCGSHCIVWCATRRSASSDGCRFPSSQEEKRASRLAGTSAARCESWPTNERGISSASCFCTSLKSKSKYATTYPGLLSRCWRKSSRMVELRMVLPQPGMPYSHRHDAASVFQLAYRSPSRNQRPMSCCRCLSAFWWFKEVSGAKSHWCILLSLASCVYATKLMMHL